LEVYLALRIQMQVCLLVVNKGDMIAFLQDIVFCGNTNPNTLVYFNKVPH